ncbi:MAG: hypothetical protein EP335_14080 [Alphaproteobacteria bacterium]|nr:MAG: hypothetical protein EP335_14080 [Alphaproteobacteria bacterium]
MLARRELAITFGVWAGAWGFLHLIDHLSIHMQVRFMGAWGLQDIYQLYQHEDVMAGISLFVALLLSGRSAILLAATFSVFSVVFQALDGTLYYLAVATSPVTAPPQSLVSYILDRGALVRTMAGYGVVAAFWLLLISSGLTSAILRTFARWLQFDTEAVARWWRWWLSLPLWSSMAWLRRAVRAGVPAYCIAAAVNLLSPLLLMALYLLLYAAIGQQEPLEGWISLYLQMNSATLLTVALLAAIIGSCAGRLGVRFDYFVSVCAVALAQLPAITNGIGNLQMATYDADANRLVQFTLLNLVLETAITSVVMWRFCRSARPT